MNYVVSIDFNYICEASDEQEAIHKSMERFRGRKYSGVYFDGMITNAEETIRMIPVYKPEMRSIDVNDDIDNGGLYGSAITKSSSRDRKDSKEQDHIHFSSADSV